MRFLESWDKIGQYKYVCKKILNFEIRPNLVLFYLKLNFHCTKFKNKCHYRIHRPKWPINLCCNFFRALSVADYAKSDDFDHWPEFDQTWELSSFFNCLESTHQELPFAFLPTSLRPSVRELDRGKAKLAPPPPSPAGLVRPNAPAGRGLKNVFYNLLCLRQLVFFVTWLWFIYDCLLTINGLKTIKY